MGWTFFRSCAITGEASTIACERMSTSQATVPARKDFLAVGLPKLLNGASTLAVSLLAIRALEPAAYGVLNFGLACLTMFDALVGSALDLSVTTLITTNSAVDESRAQPEEIAAVAVKLVLAAASLALFAAMGDWLGYRFLHVSGGRRLFLTLAVAGAGILLLRSVQLYFQARLQFRLYGLVDAVHGALRILLAGAVLLSRFASPLATLACFAAAPALIVAVCAWRLRGPAAWRISDVRGRDMSTVLAGGASSMATFSVSAVVSRLDIFFIALRGTPAALGLYSSALTLATIPEMLGAYMAPAFLPRILPACRDASFATLFRRVHAWIFLSCAVLLAGAFVAGKPILSALLPDRYGAAIGLVLILLPGTLAAASYFPLTLNFLMLRNSKVFLVTECAAAPLLAVAYYFLTPWRGIAAAAMVTCAYRILKAIAAQSAAARLSSIRT
jgi:O-antigen/teichoic acid export membrane protein